MRAASFGERGLHRVGTADVLHVGGDRDEGVDHLFRVDGPPGGRGHPQRFREVTTQTVVYLAIYIRCMVCTVM